MHPNRIAVYLTALAGLLGAIAVPLGNLDTQSTAGVIAGLATIATAAVTWLRGWQLHEQRQADDTDNADGLPHVPTTHPSTIPADQGDKGSP